MSSSRPDAVHAFALHRKALAALSRSAAVGSGDLQASLHGLTELATQILDVDRASVWRLHADRGEIECLDLYERTKGEHSTGTVLTRALAPNYFTAIQRGEVIAATDALVDPRTAEFGDSYLRPLGIGAMLDVPVFRGEEMIGLICHEHVGATRTWTEWDELLASSVADMLALVATMSERVAAQREIVAHHEHLEGLVEQRTAELRRTEAMLRERGDTLHQIFAAAPVPLVLTGLQDAAVRYCNDRAAEMFGLPSTEIIGRRAPDFYVDPASRAAFVERLRTEGRVDGYAALLKTSSAEPFWALMSAHTIELSGESMFMVGFVNISSQKAIEAELKRVNESLSRTLEVIEERDRHIREDLDEARAFQRAILPTMPTDPRVRFAALYRPKAEVGGDIYDIVELGSGTYRVFIADARGHGVQAALRTMILRAEYERVRREATGPGHLLEQLNQRIVSRYPGMHLQCTAACFDVSPDHDGARVTFAAAAHPPFLHITPSGSHELILSGPHLGVLPEVDISTAEIHLARGERFLAYTDGLYEQPGANNEMYGVDRMLSDMTIEVPLDDVPARVLTAVETFAGCDELVDDVTLVVLEVR